MIPFWVPSSKPFPRFSIEAGYDDNNNKIYVGRAKHLDKLIPASVYKSIDYGIVTWDGSAHGKIEYEYLVGVDYAWQQCQDGEVPDNAVRTGRTMKRRREDKSLEREWLYVGRAQYEGTLMVGTIQPSEKCIYIPHKRKEIKLQSYEVLYLRKFDNWKLMATNADIFPDAVEVGEDRDYSKMYVARWFFQELMYPVKFIPDREEAIICQDGPEHKVTMVHVLLGDNYIWQKATSEDVYDKAVYTGYTMDGDILFVGRGYHDDVLCVGLVSLAHNALIAPYGGKVIGIEDFEVLIRI